MGSNSIPTVAHTLASAVVANSKPLSGTSATGTPPKGPRSGSTTRPRRNAASTVALFGHSDSAQPMISRE